MNIDFIGSSHGVPSATRHCTCMLLECGESLYLLDAGAPVTEELIRRGAPLGNIRAVFISHAHGDHAAGLFAFADLLNWKFPDSRVDFYLPDERLGDLMSSYVRTLGFVGLDTTRLRPCTVEGPGVVYQDENIRVTYIENKHCGDKYPSYSMLIEGEGKRLLFTGDLSPNLEADDFPTVALEEPLDAVVCELSHFQYAHVAPYWKRMQTKQLWVEHIWPLSKIDEVNADKANYPFPIYIAEDHDTFTV